jgi:biopolymer transport protein ExbD
MKNNAPSSTSVLSPILIIAFLNILFLFLLMIVFYSFFATPVGYEIRMPSVTTRSMDTSGSLSIRINAENVLYLNEKVVTLNDLKKRMIKINVQDKTIYVQVDTRASMARVADVWEICKGLGAAQVSLSTF